MKMDFLKYISAEKNAMELSVYLESEKEHRNLRLDERGQKTDTFFLNWINEHSALFRRAWDQSMCKLCKKVMICHFCLKEECLNFEKGE